MEGEFIYESAESGFTESFAKYHFSLIANDFFNLNFKYFLF